MSKVRIFMLGIYVKQSRIIIDNFAKKGFSKIVLVAKPILITLCEFIGI